MRWTSLLLIAGLAAGSVAHGADQVKILSLNDIAVAQQNADGTFDVVCANGNRENVSAVDIRLGNVCPNDTSSVPTGVLSLQKRSDGQFDVVCRDLTKVIATMAQILNNEVCSQSNPPPPPQTGVFIEDGVYSAQSGSDCTIRASYQAGTLAGLHAEFTGTSSDMTCDKDLCTGMFSGFSQTYYFRILSKTSFEYSYDNHQGAAVYTKKQ